MRKQISILIRAHETPLGLSYEEATKRIEGVVGKTRSIAGRIAYAIKGAINLRPKRYILCSNATVM